MHLYRNNARFCFYWLNICKQKYEPSPLVLIINYFDKFEAASTTVAGGAATTIAASTTVEAPVPVNAANAADGEASVETVKETGHPTGANVPGHRENIIYQ